MSWWGSSLHSWAGEWKDGSGAWGQEDWQQTPADKKDKEKDRFKNVTSLGAPGKHALPLEDRKALLVTLVNVLSPSKPPLSKIAVSRFSAVATHALIHLLSRASPKMSIRLLRGDDGAFSLDQAAQILAQTAITLHPPEVG